MQRKIHLDQGEIYHVFNRSIADFKIFNSNRDYLRFIYLMKFFQVKNPPTKFSYFIKLKEVQQFGFWDYLDSITESQFNIVQIIAYCLMPTHFHFILKQLAEFGISKFIGNISNGYSRYFNTKHKRKGPLWESKFQNVRVENDEQLIHLTRYLHLNPVTAHLTENPQAWQHSSYNEYLNKAGYPFCQYNDLLAIKPKQYHKFVTDRKSYQRELAIIKRRLTDES
ncbi:MAG: transposase [Patescibacteria group bacterium]